ncbi:hypothetical protein [Paenibacillus sp. Soil724D2]|uniref:hypothetical protein n=1 Tax=Paenibacillus sp. (strain Soil724D2) TaxID=1736392 RepID=UPI0007160478|nr:hypothetical protein [Paenibacillus sp. Soil724D2]KRE44275.1 hypothetical protein ASG85_33075 [Paenibacillus sp. Soil724D2]
MIKHSSIVNGEILKEFKDIMGINLMNNAANTCTIEQHLSVASVFWPEIIEIGDYIFISNFFNGEESLKEIKERFNNDRRQIEKWVNSWSIGDFFLMSSDESVRNEIVFMEFARVLKSLWEIRLKHLFPERKIVVELDYGLMGELGLTIVVYQE